MAYQLGNTSRLILFLYLTKQVNDFLAGLVLCNAFDNKYYNVRYHPQICTELANNVVVVNHVLQASNNNALSICKPQNTSTN